MLFKLFLIVAGIAFLFKWGLGKWPWEYLKSAPTRSQAIFKARKLLAVSSHADRGEITAAHKRLVAMVHPDKGGTNAQMHEANDARDLLLDELPHEGTKPE
jgi:hypothetical protein